MTNKKWFAAKWFVPVIGIAALALCGFTFRVWPAVMQPAGHGKSSDEQAIRNLNEECLHAYDIGDVATLDRIEESDFTLSGDFGVISKQQHLEAVRHRAEKQDVISRKIDPQTFRFFEGVALVTETDRPTGTGGTFAFQSTEVWVHRGDSWKLVHLHYSPLTEKQ